MFDGYIHIYIHTYLYTSVEMYMVYVHYQKKTLNIVYTYKFLSFVKVVMLSPHDINFELKPKIIKQNKTKSSTN